jgi:O-antigen/teichoic acid export membrane protein
MSLDTLETFPTGSERIGLAALGRASLVYALGGLAYKGVALVTIPLLARLLSPGQLGLLDLAAVLASIVGIVAVQGTDQSIAFHQARTESPDTLWSSVLAIVAIVGATIAGVGLLFQAPLAAVLTGDASNGAIIAAAGLYGGVIALSATALNAVRLRGSPRAYAVASFLIVSAEMAVALALAWLADAPVSIMVVGWAIGATAVLVPLLARFLPRLHAPNRQTMRRLVLFGAPLVPATVAWLVGDVWIRATLAREAELTTLGEYGIAYRVASVLGLVVTGFGVAWYPFLYRSPAAEVVPRASQALTVLMLALATLGVILAAFSVELIAIVAGPAYADARHAIAPLVGGMVALGAFVLVGAVVGASGSTRRIAVAAVLGAAMQIIASALLVPAFGLIGGAWASLVGYVFAACLLVATELRIVSGRGSLAVLLVIAATAGGLFAASVASGSSAVVQAVVAIGFAVLAGVMTRWIMRGRGWAHLSS